MAGAALSASAAPLAESAAVYFRPDEKSAIVAVMEAGTEPVLTADPLGSTPTGWMAVKYSGPFDGFVPNGDLTKTLNVKEGATIRVLPTNDAPVLTTMQPGDKAELAGLRGRFTQVTVQKSLVVYIRPGGGGAGSTQTSAVASLSAPASADPAAAKTAVTARPAPPQNPADLPRVFQGKVTSTRRLLAPRRPYDYQLNDESGSRLAYLDLSRLLQTAQFESYLEQTVVVQGTARNVPELGAIVITVESLSLQ